jgi:hypothetical protein
MVQLSAPSRPTAVVREGPSGTVATGTRRARPARTNRLRRCRDGHSLNQRVRPVLGDSLPRWQGSEEPRQLSSASPSTAWATCLPSGARLRLRRPAEQALQLSGQPAEAGVIRLAGNDAVALHTKLPL